MTITASDKLAYSISEAIQATSIKRSCLYSHIATGRLKSVKISGRTVIPADALRAFVAGE